MKIKQRIRDALSPFARKVLYFQIQALQEQNHYLTMQFNRLSQEKNQSRHELLDGVFPSDATPETLPEEYRHMSLSGRALWKLISDYNFKTVLDIGSGEGHQAAVLLSHGKIVTALDYGESPYFKARDPNISTVIGDFNKMQFTEPFDCVWASHVLEHQLNPHDFLKGVHSVTKEGGIVAITVPPLKHQIVGGHLSLWNGGLLLYHLVLAGFDCKEVSILQYGYNISVIVRKRSIPFPDVVFDMGDIRTIRPYLPEQLSFERNSGDDPFNGNIQRLNW
ncbi:class I SAM-dependent methyltransferase [Ochrobactrum quorumnocens]|uniref:Class I SAM-dependent methyltransferase n=1 Tax=Ochrobactrum quorumnocens TaxID=271865 RepID=A0A5N1KCC1_9HYPH|nr:class I SAM-dependent methyltransferase [[Ochrobactrum] quorumnocens]KAA9370915.1 class I SAM-dependent methyltransferase [[Ochrobactrum] quorumnocens]